MVVTFPRSIRGGFSSCVGQLDAWDGSRAFEFLDDRFERFGLLIIPQACIGPRDTSFGGDGSGFDHDESSASACQASVVDLMP